MKKPLSIIYSLLSCFFLLSITESNAQINYSEDFESVDDIEWTTGGGYYWLEDEESCDGYSVAGNLYYFEPDPGISVSGLIGVSNGDPATLSYSYKILDYWTLGAYPNTPAWGEFSVEYGPSATGPWTEIETITPSNHIVSDECAVRTVTFTPPVGNVYLRLVAQVNSTGFTDALLYFDDVVVIQETCSGTPAASHAVAAEDEVCINVPAELSISPGYTMMGLSYQWQSSTDGDVYEDVETGGNNEVYFALQSVDTWYRVVVTCDSSEESTISEAVLVETTGEVCYCEVEFASGVEPITLVEFAGIENATSAVYNGTPDLEDFTDLDPAQVTIGQTYTAYFEGNTVGNYENSFIVYIDFNQNGNFNDEGESFEMSSIVNSDGQDGQQSTGEITIPEDAMTGITRMRVYKNYFDSGEPIDYPEFPLDACGDENNGFGQAEDYLINISADGVLELGYVNLQFPGAAEINEGETVTVYAQAWGEGVTEAAGAAAGLDVWIGVSDEDTDPETWTTWIPATFNVQAGNNDEFMAEIGDGLMPGTYYYASRFQLNGGDFVYGGYTSEGGGFWDGTNNTSGVLTVNCNTEAPTVNAEQEFCNGATVSDLMADGENVLWYETEESISAFTDNELLIDGIYYASKTINGCESERVEVTVTINVVPIPEGESEQTLDIPGSTLNNIVVIADGTLLWYASMEDYENGNPLDSETPLTDGATYYGAQTVGECESQPLAVTVTATLSSKGFNDSAFAYYPNPVKEVLTLSYNDNITGVEVYNLLGQLVLTQSVNQNEVTVNMAKLSAGSYLVKVNSENASKTIKVIKQ